MHEPIPNIMHAAKVITRMRIEAFELQMKVIQRIDEYNFYSEYTPQLISTNELSQIYELKNHIKPGAKVLTVSASGEQPLFCKLYGAGDVITFDISYNAYLLTSVKVAALRAFQQPDEYSLFMHNLMRHCAPGDLINTPKLNYIMPYLTYIQKHYIIATDDNGIPVFLPDKKCDFYEFERDQYDALRKSIRTPFPFIWTNIMDLDKHLGNDSFDIVYYSNILEFLKPDATRFVLENTKKHINPNGKLFTLSSKAHLSKITNAINDAFNNQTDWDIDFVRPKTATDFYQIIIQRKQNTK